MSDKNYKINCYTVHSEHIVVPDSIRYLNICADYDPEELQEFDGHFDNVVLPDNVYEITFVDAFDQNIDNIKFPVNLHTIDFGNRFNQNIDNVRFPNTLHTIKFGSSFNQKLDNVKFPNGLHTVQFGLYFNQKINNIKFSVNLHTIDISHCYPDRYHKFDMLNCYYDISKLVFPYTIKEVIISERQKGLLKLPYGCCEIIKN